MVDMHIEHWSISCAYYALYVYCALCVYCASCVYVMHLVHDVHILLCHAEAMENSGLKPEVCGMQSSCGHFLLPDLQCT